MPTRVITLTSDFGLYDPYVAAVKGVILEIAPSVQLVDVSHLVEPQAVAEGAYLLQSIVPYFPPDAIHLAVVDPGVGTDRKPVAIRGERGYFVGPDNGLFAPVLEGQACLRAADGRLVRGRAVELREQQYRRSEVTATFHGRDIFGPAAAHLAAGVPLGDLGPPLDRLCRLALPAPSTGGKVVRGEIIHIDRFGNAISNLRPTDLPPSPEFECRGHRIRGLVGTYAEGELSALTGSTGLVEVALRNGNASQALGIRVGDVITVRRGV